MARSDSKKIIIVSNIGKSILTAVFIYAAYSKIIDPTAFIKNVKAYEMLPRFLINPFGHSLPFLEVIAGILIWIPKWINIALGLMGFMLVLFIAAISYAIITDKIINCGCFDSNQEAGPMQLIIDLILLLDIIFLSIFFNKKDSSLSSTGE